jgi:ATP adenylyltransferase/5',5'''-P-1,P-4-tetraphosphate phosphorylase II
VAHLLQPHPRLSDQLIIRLTQSVSVIMKLLITKFSPVPYHILPVTSKYVHRQNILKNLNLYFVLTKKTISKRDSDKYCIAFLSVPRRHLLNRDEWLSCVSHTTHSIVSCRGSQLYARTFTVCFTVP